VVILHYALPSALSAALIAHRGRRVLLHHNITPPEFFVDWDPEMVRICTLGQAEYRTLAPHVDLGLADSEFNRLELERAGFARTAVLPIYLDFRRYREPPDPVLLRLLDDGRRNLLFVGRLAPNKRPDDVIRLAAYWKRFIAPDVRLLLVGKLPRRLHYFHALQSFAYEHGLGPQEVLFLGHVDHAELLACYASADLLVCLSDHEGFGVPLVEAMLMDVPVLAYRSTAVPHTLGDAGVQFAHKDFAVIAELGQRLLEDAGLRAQVLEGQRRRLQAFAPASVEAALRGYIESLWA
jgi:glycosyltransferase involved in cell wall biosynthesis